MWFEYYDLRFHGFVEASVLRLQGSWGSNPIWSGILFTLWQVSNKAVQNTVQTKVIYKEIFWNIFPQWLCI